MKKKVPDKQVKNRKPGTWPPGVSGNPAGRPPDDRSLAAALREIVDPAEFAQTLWDLARGIDPLGLPVEPSLAALRLIFERLEPPPATNISATVGLDMRTEILKRLDAATDDDEGLG